MKAYVLHGINDLQYEDREMPELEAGTVLVKVKAAGICGSDIPRIYRTGAYFYPLITGHEFAGVVSEVGTNVPKSWLGKRVGVFPLIPCMECSPCQKMEYEMCKKYSYLGSRTDGGFAEYVRVPLWNLIELPETVSYEQAAMLEPMAVAIHGIRRSSVCEEDTIAVCGMGTIGLFVVMFLLEMRCKNILVIGNKDFQKETVERLGIPAEQFCDARTQNVEEWLDERTGGRGVSVFFDCVGRNEVVLQGINSVSPKGTVLLLGNPASDMNIEKGVYWKVLRKQLTMIGTWNSSFAHDAEDDWHYVLELLKENKIHPEMMITHRFPLEKLREGFEIMRDKKEDYIKVLGVL